MVLGALIFATMGVCVKIASQWFSSAELVFYRGLIGIVFLWLLARNRGVPLKTRYPLMHAWRSLIGVASLGAWFYAIAHMPLATAMTLNYMSSVWIAAFLVGGALLAWVPVPGRDGSVPRPPLQGPLILTVLAGSHDPHKYYALVLRDAVTKVEVLRLPIKVDLAFGNDF